MASLPSNIAKQIYNSAERAILDPFKADYIATSTKATRKQFFVSRIWPMIYKYWFEKEGLLTQPEIAARVKVMLSFDYLSAQS